MEIYKRKQENTLLTKKAIKKKERKHALEQENDQEMEKLSFFLGRFLARDRVLFLFFLLSCFLL